MQNSNTYSFLDKWKQWRQEVLGGKYPRANWLAPKVWLLTVSMLLGGAGDSLAQSLSRFAFVSGGGVSSTGKLSSSIGQLWTNTTHKSHSLLLTQGFQQPVQTDSTGTASLFSPDLLAIGMKLYPNPVHNIAILELQTEGRVNLEIVVYDLLGRKTSVPVQTVRFNQSVVSRVSLDLAALSSAVYVLSIRDIDTGRQKNLKFVKQN